PGRDAIDSPPGEAVEVAIYTGLGQARNQVVVLSAAAVVAVAGGWGTLSEIALALKHGIPVISLASWNPEPLDGEGEPLLRAAASPEEAVRLALAAARDGRRRL
ncbi:MAG TPA: dethiobiotin synthetase, partial [Thermoanaerobaculia bacterium]|nr:dethiobiotin synthetase [Thermoanaerobaculia bacterium]